MRRRRLAVVATLAIAGATFGGALGATPAAASSYVVELVAPTGDEVRGRVPIRVVSRGLGTPTGAAFQVRPLEATWDEALRVPLRRTGEGFEGVVDTRPYPNGQYWVLVRAWGGDPVAYDASDGESFVADSLVLQVSNPPPRPALNHAPLPGRGRVALSWGAVATADRPDFAGYGVYRAGAADDACPDFGTAYERVETTFANSHVSSGLSRGPYCFAVVALRASPTTGEVASRPSAPALARVTRGGPAIAGGADPGSADGPYDPTLPYDPTELVQIVSAVFGGAESLREAGPNQERIAFISVAIGVLLTVLAAGLLIALRAPRTLR